MIKTVFNTEIEEVVNSLVKKTDYDSKTSEIEGK